MSAQKAIRFEGQVTGLGTRVDGGLGVRMVTPELNSEEKTAFFEIQNLLVEVLIYPKDSKDAEVLTVKKQIDGKSPSQRLHSVLFLLWKHEGESGNFEAYYINRMEKLIEQIKARLPEQ